MTETTKNEFEKLGLKNKKFCPRILVVGPAGMGKSTLVNTVFGLREEERAAVRAGGTPCTDRFKEYGPFDHIPVILIDSQGIEKEEADKQRNAIVSYVREKNNDIDVCMHVHVVWYVPGDRWETSDTKYVEALTKIVKVVVAITRCDLRMEVDGDTNKTGLEQTREAIVEHAGGLPIVECASPPEGSQHWVPRQCPGGHGIGNFTVSNNRGTWVCDARVASGCCNEKGRGKSGPFGYVKLVEHTIEALPELFRDSFRIAQAVDMKKKNEYAGAAIAVATFTSMGVGAVPFPVPDLPVLLGVEAGMVATLFAIYQVDPKIVTPETWLKLNTVVAGVVGVAGYATAKALKTSILLAPIGVVVDAAVAGTVVATIGCTIAIVSSKLPVRDHSSTTKDTFAEQLNKTAASFNLGELVKAGLAGVGSKGQDGGVFAAGLEKLISSWTENGSLKME